MGGQVRRKPIVKFYKPCLECSSNTGKFGKCEEGYDNFFARRTKVNHCPKCAPGVISAAIDRIGGAWKP